MAWMDLKEAEILVVEGVEDFDKLKEASALVNQVKNLSAPISLRSQCVIEALRNFWIAKHKNPARTIQFRLITTAPFGIEAGAPFGSSRPGLDLWNEETAISTVQSSQQIKDFLLSDSSVSPESGVKAHRMQCFSPMFMGFLLTFCASTLTSLLVK